MFKTFMGTLTLIVVLVGMLLGSLWGLFLLAFGQAKITGVNIPAAIALGIVVTIIIFVVFSLLDGFSDFVAAWSATRGNKNTVKEMQELARAQGAQLGAYAASIRAQQAAGRGNGAPAGGLDYDEDEFRAPTSL